MSCLTLLSVLGLAIGLSAWNPGDNQRNYSIGAGIWSIISALVSFYIGGWLAARSAAAVGERNGLLNGAMVWAVAIPLLLFLLGGGFASLAQTAVDGGRNHIVYLDRGMGDITDRAQTAGARMGDVSNPNVGTNQNQSAAMPSREDARNAAKGAWWTLVSLVLGLCAAGFGGLVGAGSVYDRDRDITGSTTGGTTSGSGGVTTNP